MFVELVEASWMVGWYCVCFSLGVAVMFGCRLMFTSFGSVVGFLSGIAILVVFWG